MASDSNAPTTADTPGAEDIAPLLNAMQLSAANEQRKASSKIFTIYELVEHILNTRHLEPKQIIQLRKVNKTFNAVIERSLPIHDQLSMQLMSWEEARLNTSFEQVKYMSRSWTLSKHPLRLHNLFYEHPDALITSNQRAWMLIYKCEASKLVGPAGLEGSLWHSLWFGTVNTKVVLLAKRPTFGRHRYKLMRSTSGLTLGEVADAARKWLQQDEWTSATIDFQVKTDAEGRVIES